MEENLKSNASNLIKILNKENILEFQLNKKSGFEESEIIIQNISKGTVLTKLYINNFKNFKCIPCTLQLSKNSTSKIKITKVNKDYNISNSDIFLIIAHQPENSDEKFDEKKINEIFKNDEIKEKGQKVYLIGYKKNNKKNEEKNKDEDELVKKIKELEKEVFEEGKIDEEIPMKIGDEKNIKRKNSNFIYLIIFSLLVFVANFFLMKYLGKYKKEF